LTQVVTGVVAVMAKAAMIAVVEHVHERMGEQYTP